MKLYLKIFVASLVFASCEKEDIVLPPTKVDFIKQENFNTAINNADITNFVGWKNITKQGNSKWKEKVFSGNGYAEFSSFSTGSTVDEAWLVSPAIDLGNSDNPKFATMKIAQHHLDVDSPGNSLRIFVSKTFDGTTINEADWTEVTGDKVPKKAEAWYAFKGSTIDLKNYTGNVYVAFKFVGSGTDTTLDGAFQIDDFNVFKY